MTGPLRGAPALGVAGLGTSLAVSALPAAGAALAARFALTHEQLGLAVSVGLWVYAFSAAFNGGLVDRFGGRRALLAGAGGAAGVSLAAGLLFAAGGEEKAFALIALLYASGRYFQSFTTSAAAKLNATRLKPAERGTYGGLFGAMAFPGEFLALPAALWLSTRVPWAALALLPAAAALLAFAAARAAAPPAPVEPGPRTRELLREPAVLALAAGGAFAGFARWGLLGWSTQFLAEVHHIRAGEPLFAAAGLAAAAGAAVGPLLCAALSDRAFQGRRAPAAAAFFGLQAAALFALGRASSPGQAVACLGLACAGVFGVHSLLTGAAAMEAVEPRSTGAAAGLVDGAHHAAGAVAALAVGVLLERGGWGAWTTALIPVCLAGGAGALLAAWLKAAVRDPDL